MSDYGKHETPLPSGVRDIEGLRAIATSVLSQEPKPLFTMRNLAQGVLYLMSQNERLKAELKTLCEQAITAGQNHLDMMAQHLTETTRLKREVNSWQITFNRMKGYDRMHELTYPEVEEA